MENSNTDVGEEDTNKKWEKKFREKERQKKEKKSC